MKNKFTKSTYRPLPYNLTIKASNIDGLGLYATNHIPAGTNLGITHHYTLSNTIRTPLGGFINHSDTPNCYICVEEQHNVLHTVTCIGAGEELTVCYRLELSDD
jgi:SET domain-containing protein